MHKTYLPSFKTCTATWLFRLINFSQIMVGMNHPYTIITVFTKLNLVGRNFKTIYVVQSVRLTSITN